MTGEFNQLFPCLNQVHGQGSIKSKPEDFIVKEINDLDFTESGEHLWLKVRKEGCNTAWVATQLSSVFKVPARQVGFAGLKDRHAITEQWFSVQLPQVKELDLIKKKLPASIQILGHHYHQTKIKRGQLCSNEFDIIIRNIKTDQQLLESNIKAIKKFGVPNYFGPQRFGHHMANIQLAQDWFDGSIKINNRNKKSLYISAARSFLFNSIVAARIKQNCWHNVIQGDIIQLDGTKSWFPASAATADEITSRMAQFDIHITAAMWGEDAVQSQSDCAEFEQHIANQFPFIKTGMALNRVKQDRRSIRVIPQALDHQWDEGNLRLNFKLQPGSYATCILREIINYTDISSQFIQADKK